MGKIGSWFSRILRRPVSHVIAPAIGIGALLQLLFGPSPMTSPWTALANTINNWKANQGATLATDLANVGLDFQAQILANALPAALTGIGAAVVYKVGRWLGL